MHPDIASANGVSLPSIPSTSKYRLPNEQAQPISVLTCEATTKFKVEPVEVTSKKKARSLFARGTRGRGDPRNEAMRQARQRYMESKSAKNTRNTGNQQRRPEGMLSRSRPISGPDQNASQIDGSADNQNPLPVNSGSFSQARRTQNHGQSISVHGPPSDLRPNNRFMRPEPRAPISSSQQPNNARGPLARREDDWTHWLELNVKLSRLESSVTTRDLWMNFSREGPVISIELFEDHNGRRDGKGRVRFG